MSGTNGKAQTLTRRPPRAPAGSLVSPKPATQRALAKKPTTKVAKKKKVPKSRKEQEIFDRRMRVYQLRQRGYTYERIGKELQISYLTVKKDMDAVHEMARDQVVDFDGPGFIAKELASYDDLIKSGWREYERGANGVQRVKALEFIRQTKSDKVKALKDVGVVAEKPVETTSVNITAAVIKGWTPEVQVAASKAILESLMPAQLPEPIPEEVDSSNIIEVEATEEPAASGGSNVTP